MDRTVTYRFRNYTPEQLKIVLGVLAAFGGELRPDDKGTNARERNPHMFIDEDWPSNPVRLGTNDSESDYMKDINFQGYLSELIKYYTSSTRVKLTDDYTAKINFGDRTVEVGCQSIPFDNVLLLADKIRAGLSA